MGSSAVRASWILAFVASSASLTLAQKTPDVRLDVGDPPGASESSNLALASSGTSVFVTYLDARNATSLGPEVYFNRSLDGGLTWLSPDVPLETPGAEPGVVAGRYPVIAAEGSSVYVAWSDDRNGQPDIYFNRSLDAGSTWFPAEVRLDLGDAPGENVSYYPVIAAHGSSVYVAWGDERSPGNEFCSFVSCSTNVFLNRSLDGGATWLPEAVYVSRGLPSVYFPSLDLVATSSALHVVFAKGDGNVGSQNIYYNHSEDGGLTWLPASIRIDRGSSPSEYYTWASQIAASGSNVYVVWADNRYGGFGGGGDVFFNGSTDGGATWLASDVRLNTGSGNYVANECQVIASGTAVYVVWEDYRNGGIDIFFNRSLDAGTSWLPTDVRLDVGVPAGSSNSYRPRIALSGEDVYVTWGDGRPGAIGIYLNRSLDQGATWLPTDVRLDTDMAGANNPEIAASGSSVYVAWHDFRNGEADIYFNLANGYQPYGQGTPGSGAIVPRLTGSGTASIGGTASVNVEQGRGGAVCALVYSFSGPAAIASNYGTLLLQPPWSSKAVMLGGASGVPGAGSVSVSAAVPNDLALLGLRVNFQAGVFDPDAAGGVALTNGLELWVL